MQNPARDDFSVDDLPSAEVGAPPSEPIGSEFPLIEALHRSPPDYRDESLAPEVDRELLVCLVRGQLDEPSARLVFRLVESFRSWRDAHNELLIAVAKRAQ